MGQKIHPRGFRLGQTHTWSSRWFATGRQYREFLRQDLKLREKLFAKLKLAGLAQVDIERSINKVGVTLFVAKPGMVIGRGGSGLEELKKFIEQFFTDAKLKIEVTVEPVKEPNLNARLVASNIADGLAKRLPHKRVCNQALARVLGAGAKGVRIVLGGRIGGAEIARREKYQAGTIPLSTIREEVDYASVPSLTRSGYVGVKVWICRK
ncbi:30S ribosomal protein S3 [Candidatus Gottesmanbacteria bacterium]|nr:30S ribosomal protein S3 [Candidatus Gottesmanbacteria bacterium]